MRTYYGINIHPAYSLAGMRWTAFIPNVGFVRADTLAGIRELIRANIH